MVPSATGPNTCGIDCIALARLLVESTGIYPLAHLVRSNTEALSDIAADATTVPALFVTLIQPENGQAVFRKAMYGNIRASDTVGVVAGCPTASSAN